MLHLHVWGPAFGLPSIDAECLAIIAYFHNVLPSSSWRLITSNDPAVSPSSKFVNYASGGEVIDADSDLQFQIFYQHCNMKTNG